MTLIGAMLWLLLVRWWDAARPESWAATLAMVVLGAAASPLVFVPGDVAGLLQVSDPSGQTAAAAIPASVATGLADALSAVLGIGLVEETVKLLPLLVLLPLRRLIDEPVDWAVYGCLSALGFSALENYQYLLQYGVHAGVVRVFYSTPFHMSLTGGVVLRMVFSKGPGLVKAMDGAWALAVAAVLHGAYDFLLTHQVLLAGFMSTMLVIVLLRMLALNMERAELLGLAAGSAYRAPHSQARWVIVAFVVLAAIAYFINIREVGHVPAAWALLRDGLMSVTVVWVASALETSPGTDGTRAPRGRHARYHPEGGSIRPDGLQAWVVVLVSAALTLLSLAWFIYGGGAGAIFCGLMSGTLLAFAAQPVSALQIVRWTSDGIEGPCQLFGFMLGSRRASLRWEELARSGKVTFGQSGMSYWYVEARDRRRIYWHSGYRGWGDFARALREHCPELELPPDME